MQDFKQGLSARKQENIFVLWFLWQFYKTPKFLLSVWRNYIMFALNFFSMPVLLKSLFSPWKRYNWSYPKWYNVGEFLGTLISNIFSRIIGAVLRIVLIFCGIILQLFVILTGLIIILLWLIFPFIILAGLLFVIIY